MSVASEMRKLENGTSTGKNGIKEILLSILRFNPIGQSILMADEEYGKVDNDELSADSLKGLFTKAQIDILAASKAGTKKLKTSLFGNNNGGTSAKKEKVVSQETKPVRQAEAAKEERSTDDNGFER